MTRPRGAEPSRRPAAAHRDRRSAPDCFAPAGACSWTVYAIGLAAFYRVGPEVLKPNPSNAVLNYSFAPGKPLDVFACFRRYPKCPRS
eukprot:1591369-Prymnesium_polylepis.1